MAVAAEFMFGGAASVCPLPGADLPSAQVTHLHAKRPIAAYVPGCNGDA